MITYPQQSIERKLGMDTVRSYIAELCLSEPARELVNSMRPLYIFSEVKEKLEQTSEMLGVINGENSFSLDGITDARQWFVVLKTAGAFLEPEDLNSLRRILKIAGEVKTFFNGEETPYPSLKVIADKIMKVDMLLREVNRILTDNGDVKDNASPQLSEIRRKLSGIQGRISSTMRRVLSRAISDGIVDSDTLTSMRDGRLVIPVAAMNKKRINGIVHDESATGKTFYIEPAEIVELSNEQRELEMNERREIVKILTELCDILRPHLPEIIVSYEILILLDFIKAKAEFARDIGGNLVELVDKCNIEWHDARHPVLYLKLLSKGRSVVPLNIDLNRDTSRILVLSGPNAGGKSVALKTVGINQYMLQCGLLPSMEPNSRAGIFEGIFVDIGDDQSMEDDLSTYSSHLRNMRYILSHGNDKSLILIDEFGAGTEPQIGGAIAQALLTEFNDKKMWGVITTHYQNLKQLAQETDGMINGSMLYDRQKMQPTFNLLLGNPGSSFAIEIAMRSGLPKSLIEQVEKIVGTDYFNLDKYLLDINRDRRYWENKRSDIRRREKHLEDVIARYEENAEKLRQQRRVIFEEAKTQADNIIAKSNALVEQTIREIKQAQAEKESTRKSRENLDAARKEIASEQLKDSKELRKAPRPKKSRMPKQDVLPEKITVGDNVLLDNQGQPGEVLEIKGNKAIVSFGMLKTSVDISRLNRTLRKPQTGATKGVSILSSQTTEASRKRQLAFSTELDVRGMRADEAVQAVTYFIDDALQFNANRVRILHGTGTGALRTVIRQYLATVGALRDFHDEDVRLGGAGITVVEI